MQKYKMEGNYKRRIMEKIINSMYYFLYHVISKQLDENSIRWVSAITLRNEYFKLSIDKPEYKQISSKFYEVFKLYQKVNVDYGPKEMQNDNLEKIKDLQLIDKIYSMAMGNKK